MCIVTKYVYVCTHQASDVFRNEVCARPGSSSCVPAKRTLELEEGCKQCISHAERYNPERLKQLKPRPQGGGDPSSNVFWYVPSRCFHDPGLQRSDPFAADRLKQQIEATEQARAARYRPASFAGFRQKLHSLRASGRPQSTSTIGSVILQIPPAPCCQSHRFSSMQNGRIGKGQRMDDQCVSHF